MTYPRLWAVGLILIFGLSIAACSTACKSDKIPVYPDSGKSTEEPDKDVQTKAATQENQSRQGR